MTQVRSVRYARIAGMMLIVLALGMTGVVRAQGQSPTPPASVLATVAVERAYVFARPERTADVLTYVYQRERLPVLGQTADGRYLLVEVETLQGWVLAAQMDISGDLTSVPVWGGTSTPQPTRTPGPRATATVTPLPTHTPLPTRTSSFTPDPTALAAGTSTPTNELPPVLPGKPPPLTIDLPAGWESLHLEVPFRSFDGVLRSVPLSVYYGPLEGQVQGYIYLYWGFPNVVDFDGEYNLWADGVQLLRGSLVGDSCNVGLDEQRTFKVGGLEGVGTYYAAVACTDQKDTTGWFAVLRVYEGSYAFFTAVEPFDALVSQRAALQAILDSVRFLPPDTP